MKNSIVHLVLGLGLVSSMVSPAFAAETFKEKHPRRAEVLNRANKEEQKNNQAAVDGKLTDRQARKLDREDQRIKREEQRQARQNGGYITKSEQAKDNRQENRVNRQRDEMEKHDAAVASAGK